MNGAHWHLLLNHIPVTISITATLLLITGLLLRNQTVQKTSLIFFIINALISIPVLLTGEGAEDVLESIGEKNEYFIHEHEEMAEKAFWVAEIAGVLSLLALYFFQKHNRNARRIIMFVLIIALSDCVLMAIASNKGGEVRHTEIRNSGSQ